MSDIPWDFLAGFFMAWLIQGARWSYDRWRTTKALVQALRDNPESVMRYLAQLRDGD